LFFIYEIKRNARINIVTFIQGKTNAKKKKKELPSSRQIKHNFPELDVAARHAKSGQDGTWGSRARV
jgi:hypothetical protein